MAWMRSPVQIRLGPPKNKTSCRSPSFQIVAGTNLFHRVHVSFIEEFGWYRAWHRRPNVNFFHWIALLFFLSVVLAASVSMVQARSKRSALDLGLPYASFEYGRSVRGHPLQAYTLGNERPAVFVVGAIHGNERSSAYLARDLVSYLNMHPAEIPPDRKIIIIPIANPDGFIRRSRYNTRSVDLNRNFGSSDWKDYSQGPRKSRSSGGRTPFSEPETEALRVFMEREGVRILISLHARGNLVNPESDEGSRNLARIISDLAGYQYEDSWAYYTVTGTMTLWTLERFQAPSITWELASYTKPDWERNGAALLAAIRYEDTLTPKF